MTELESRLRELEAPREDEAAERAWALVRAAFDDREPVARGAGRLRPLLVLAAVAVAAAALAAAFTPAGRAVLDGVRDAIGVERARPALFSLPAPGRLLVESDAGVWVVQHDGSKRLLAGYREASWSPYGAYVVATRRNEVVALESDGEVRWTLPRPGVRSPRWGGTRTDTRIAYLSRRSLRVVAGDGTGDRLLTRRVADVAPAWRPGRPHELAYVARDGQVRVVDADTGEERARWREGIPARLLWSFDGAWLAAIGDGMLSVYTADGFRVSGISTRSFSTGDPFLAAAFAPRGEQLALATWDPSANRSVVRVMVGLARERTVLEGTGRFTGLEWSPDGRWLLVAWRDADQWVFIRSSRVRELDAFSGISRQFESDRFPALAGWCCP